MKKILKNYRLPSELIKQMEEVAKATGIDSTQFVTEAIESYLKPGFEKHAAEQAARIANVAKKSPKRGK